MPDPTPPDPDRTTDFPPAADDALEDVGRLVEDAIKSALEPNPKPVLDWAGRVVEGYRLVRVRNAEGGQGVVYEGEDTTLHRKVAIKIARPNRPTDELEREAKWTAQLGGKGIVPIIRLVRDAEYSTLWMVMEWLDGRTVGELLRAGPGEETHALAWRRAFRIAADVLETLGRVHDGVNGKAHLDVKPSNILVLDKTGEVKLLDFGLAAHLDPDFGNPDRTAFCGTLLYMAPERFHLPGAAWSPPDGRLCDVYSLGATLYHMLTGVPPFARNERRADYVSFAAAHRDEPRPDPRELVPLPEFCSAVVMKAMAVKPGDRYPTTAAFRAELLRHLEQNAAPTPGGWSRRNVLVAAGASVVAVVAAVAALRGDRSPRWVETGRDREPPPPAPPRLTRLTFKVRRHEDDALVPWDVLNPATRIDRVIRPGNPRSEDKDCLQLEGEFDRPVRWHVLWHDTNGKWARARSSDGEQTGVLYPVPVPGHEVLFVEDTDPPGTHVVYLIGGSATTEQVEALLAAPPVPDAPPAALARFVGEVRGPGTGQGTAIPASDLYLAAVGRWLPPEVTVAKFITLVVGKR